MAWFVCDYPNDETGKRGPMEYVALTYNDTLYFT
jgi:hypothetical protein